MGFGDKLVNLDDLKVAYDDLNGKAGDLKSALSPLACADISWTDGKYLFVNSSNVVSEQNNENYSITGYIEIPAGINVLAHSYYSGYAKAVLYDSNKAYLNSYAQTSGVSYGEINIEVAAANVARYIRLSCYTPQKGSAFVSLTKPITEIVEDMADMNSDIIKRVKIYGSRIANKTQLTSLADAAPNTVYTFAPDSGEQQADKPADAGTMLTLNSTNDNNGGHTQIFIAIDGKIYRRIKWNRSGSIVFSDWERVLDINDLGVNTLKVYGSIITASSTSFSDLNDAAPNTIYSFNTTEQTKLSNMPVTTGTLLTINGRSENNAGHAQIFIATDNKIYIRIKWSRTGGVAFSNWLRFISANDAVLYLKGYGSRITNKTQLASLADATPNTVYTFAPDSGEQATDKPAASGTMIGLNCTTDNNGGHAQMFISSANEVYTRIKWSRTGGVLFGDWVRLITSAEFVSDIWSDATMFERIGVVGDSFASGVIYPSAGGANDQKCTHYEQSWPQCLGRICGIAAVNYSVGGCTTKSWMNGGTGGQRNYGLLKMQSTEPCGLYLLCLGINDSGLKSGTQEPEPNVLLGEEDDIGTDADTFWRWYGDIVAAIKAHAPNALIVFSTFCRKHSNDSQSAYYSPFYDDYNNAIKAIAEHYQMPCLDLTDDPFFNSSFYLDGMQNKHPTAPLYAGYAKAINRLLAKSMVDHYSYYSDYNSTQITTVDLRSQSTPTISGVANNRYMCGVPTSISITPPESGTIFVEFTSGSTPTTLTVPSSVIWPEWFDKASLQANTKYDMKIVDGTFGSVKTMEVNS